MLGIKGPKLSPWPFLGMAAMAALLFMFAASEAFLPWYAVAFLLVAWAILFIQACKRFTATSQAPVWIAAIGVVVWLIVSVGGASLFGWEGPGS